MLAVPCGNYKPLGLTVINSRHRIVCSHVYLYRVFAEGQRACPFWCSTLLLLLDLCVSTVWKCCAGAVLSCIPVLGVHWWNFPANKNIQRNLDLAVLTELLNLKDEKILYPHFCRVRQDTLAVQILFSSVSSSLRVLETQRNEEHQRIKPSNSKVAAHFKNPIIL
jgi:hypothetical protein